MCLAEQAERLVGRSKGPGPPCYEGAVGEHSRGALEAGLLGAAARSWFRFVAPQVVAEAEDSRKLAARPNYQQGAANTVLAARGLAFDLLADSAGQTLVPGPMKDMPLAHPPAHTDPVPSANSSLAATRSLRSLANFPSSLLAWVQPQQVPKLLIWKNMLPIHRRYQPARSSLAIPVVQFRQTFPDVSAVTTPFIERTTTFFCF